MCLDELPCKIAAPPASYRWMKISALIPTYNSADTIVASLRSVFSQSRPPDEIIVLLDGEVDDTAARIAEFNSRIKIVIQPNQGVACARNRLVELASGDILAFLDSDDLWHPNYLENQEKTFERFPGAVAAFTAHVRFHGSDYTWELDSGPPPPPRLLDQVAFFTEYNVTTAVFGSMSYCCVQKRAMEQIGVHPFSTDLHAIEDSYLCYRLALLGPIAYLPTILVAYRLVSGSLSENRVRNLGRWVTAFERLETQYKYQSSRPLARAFYKYYASKRREYAKVLLGVGKFKEGRGQLARSIRNCLAPLSIAKSVVLFAASLLPPSLQPTWPSPVRVTG